MNEKEFDFTKKKRVVVKIGSSSLNRGETGNLNFTKLEHLVRELCDMRNRGMDVCLVSSGAIAVGRQTIGLNETEGYFNKTGMCGGWSGKTHDDISENVCRVQPDRRTDPDDKKYNGKSGIPCECKEYI